MRRIIVLFPLLFASCAALFGGGEDKPKAAAPDTAAIVASAIDEAQAVSDAQLKELRAQLADLTHDVERMRGDLSSTRLHSQEDAASAIAAEAASASARRGLVLSNVVATLALLAALALAIVVVWQSVLLRRSQRALSEAEERAAQAVERAAMAAGRTPGAPLPAAPPAPAAAPAALPATGTTAGARLRQRPVP